MERLISKDQVRQLFGVSKSTIDRWVRAGKLLRPRRRFGFLRWDYEQVVALLKFKPRT
jgi:predicted site-specific integrase-resolvase